MDKIFTTPPRQMLQKQDLICVKSLNHGPFYRTFRVYFRGFHHCPPHTQPPAPLPDIIWTCCAEPDRDIDSTYTDEEYHAYKVSKIDEQHKTPPRCNGKCGYIMRSELPKEIAHSEQLSDSKVPAQPTAPEPRKRTATARPRHGQPRPRASPQATPPDTPTTPATPSSSAARPSSPPPFSTAAAQPACLCPPASSPARLFRLRAMSKRLLVRSELDEDMALYELYTRSNIRHPFLINQVCAFQDYDHLFYVTDDAATPVMSAFLAKRLPAASVRFYAAETLAALLYLHRCGHTYTYLTPENWLLDYSGHVKLDFGFCNCINHSPDEPYRHIEYMSPEYLTRSVFTPAGDLWSLGVALYKLAAGYTPFGEHSYASTLRAVISQDVEYPEWLDSDLKGFLELLFDQEVLSRCTVEERAAMLFGHPFFAGICWNAVEARRLAPPYLPVVEPINLQMLPLVSALFTTDYIAGDKDGYGDTFRGYHTTTFIGTLSRPRQSTQRSLPYARL